MSADALVLVAPLWVCTNLLTCCCFRTDEHDGGSNQPLCRVYSSDNGRTWTAPVPMASDGSGPHGVEPKVCVLGRSGPRHFRSPPALT